MANGAKDKKRRTILEAYYQVIKNTTPGLAVMSRPIAVGREGKECRCKGHISWSMNAYVTIMSKHLVEDCTACSQEHKGLNSFLELFTALVDQLLHVLETCVALVLDALDLGLQDTGLLLNHLLGFVAAWHVVCVGIVFSNTDLNAVRLKLTQQLSRIMTIESHR
jgi:hypothetical protein